MAEERPIRLLAPLRGVTIRAFRETFLPLIRAAGFTGAVAPFIPANPGIRVTDRLLADLLPFPAQEPGREAALAVVPQVITRHPEAMRELLKGLKDRGFARADLNAGCPFPMIVRRGRGAGLMRTPELFEKLVETGCALMGPGGFSVKMRLGLETPAEGERILGVLNRYPLAAVTVHARTARQMYAGTCDRAAAARFAAASANPFIYNGDVDLNDPATAPGFPVRGVMVGRAFVRRLGNAPEAPALLTAYLRRSQEELFGDRPVLGRLKELLAYWAEGSAAWRRLWPLVKVARSCAELQRIIPAA